MFFFTTKVFFGGVGRPGGGGVGMGALLFLSLSCTSGTIFCKPLCNEL